VAGRPGAGADILTSVTNDKRTRGDGREGVRCCLFVDIMLVMPRRMHSEEEEEEDEEGGLEIDLDYNDFVSVSLTEGEAEAEEPLDLRVPRPGDSAPGLLANKSDLWANKSDLWNNKSERGAKTVPACLSRFSPEEVGRGTLLSESEVTSLIEPYIVWDRKRAVCTVCDIKFLKREKAMAHMENKHLDCLQYKCPLCRASKVTRMAHCTMGSSSTDGVRGFRVKTQHLRPHCALHCYTALHCTALPGDSACLREPRAARSLGPGRGPQPADTAQTQVGAV
jgi:hypothetical protein